MVDLNKDYILTTFKEALKFAKADQTEIALEAKKLSLTRFAENKITQNISTSDNLVIVRTIKNKKIGVAVSNGLELEDIKATIKSAEEISAVQAADEAFISLPNSPPALTVNAFHGATDNYSPSERADAIGGIIAVGEMSRLQASGAYKIVTEHAAIVNSLGTEQYFSGTSAELSLTMTGDQNNSGYAIGCNRDHTAIMPGRLAAKAGDKAVKSVDPIELPSGQYTVIMEPPAVGQMVLLFSFLGFGCKTYMSRRSFMSGKIGRPIVGKNITLTEDPYHEMMQGMPFDFEGVTRQQVRLIERGIARGVVWNSYYADMAERKSTGHAHPAYKTFSPYPKYLVMGEGENTVEEMIASTERGIYITHFWYVNYLNPMRTMVTGTTLDGTFLIENGKITKPIVNMRMAQSIQEMLSNCTMISKERMLYPQFSVVMLLPYLKALNFTLGKQEG
jgi:predicted Zn-dependent protease